MAKKFTLPPLGGISHSKPVRFLLQYKAWLYLLPALLVITVFQIYPICKSFLMGFYTNFDYLNDIVYEWGFDNFRKRKDEPFPRIRHFGNCTMVWL